MASADEGAARRDRPQTGVGAFLPAWKALQTDTLLTANACGTRGPRVAPWTPRSTRVRGGGRRSPRAAALQVPRPSTQTPG